MSTKTMFQRALRIIPADENLKTRSFTLMGGNLYFKGDNSWFMIEDFMKGGVDCIIDNTLINPIVNMTGTVENKFVDSSVVEFTNGFQHLSLACEQDDVEVPEGIQPLPKHEYKELDDLFVRGRSMLGMLDGLANVSIFTVPDPNPTPGTPPIDEGFIALLNEKTFAVVKGEEGLDIDLTEIPAVIQGIISQKAKIKMDSQIIHCMIEEDDYTIYGCFKHAKSRFGENLRTFAKSLAHGFYEVDTPSEPVVLIEVPIPELLKILPVITQMKHDGFAKFDASISSSGESSINFKVSDSTKNEFNQQLEGSVSEDIKFEIAVFDESMLSFLCASVGVKPEDATLNIAVNTAKNRVVLRVTPNDDDVNSLCMMKIMA